MRARGRRPANYETRAAKRPGPRPRAGDSIDRSSVGNLLVSLQRTAGNAAVSRLMASGPPVVQRRILKEFAPKPVAEMELTRDGEPYWVTAMVAALELAPPGQDAATFDGYSDSLVATMAGKRSKWITVVVRDAPADGTERYHTFETFTRLLPTTFEGTIIPYSPLGSEQVVGWPRLNEPGDPTDWKTKVDDLIRTAQGAQLRKDAEGLQKAESALMDLMAEALRLPRTKIVPKREPLVPGVINFDIESNEEHGATQGGTVPTDRTSPLKEPAVTIGPGAMTDPASLESTVVHELTHAEHARTAIRWVKQWRASGSDQEFAPWILKQVKGARLDTITLKIIEEQVGQPIVSSQGAIITGSSVTESLAYLAAFVTLYHRQDVDAVEEGDAGDTKLFQKLAYLSEEWVEAGHAVQKSVLDELGQYYSTTLGPRHQERLKKHVLSRRDTTGFWSGLAKRFG